MSNNSFQIPPGLIAITTHGSIKAETATSLAHMMYNLGKSGLDTVKFTMVPGVLVDKARNDAVKTMLQNPEFQWIWMLDGDMVWEPNIAFGVINQQAQLVRGGILSTAYGIRPDADVVGGYCCLKGGRNIPTMDTGTGTWESHGPYKGAIDVMRTGAACLLIKRHVFDMLPQPYFGVRALPRPLDAVFEVDNICHQHFHLRNPFREAEPELWDQLIQRAAEDARKDSERKAGQISGTNCVGEDSNFCDKVKACGGTIVVQTDVVLGHIQSEIVGPAQHFDAMVQQEKEVRAQSGLFR